MKPPEAHELRKIVLSIQVLGHPISRQIIKILTENEQLQVRDIQFLLRIPQSSTSQHLAKLRRAGYVHDHKVGKQVFYRINAEKLAKDIFLLNELNNS